MLRLHAYADRLEGGLAQQPAAENDMTPDDVTALRGLLADQQAAIDALRADRAVTLADLEAHLAWLAGLGHVVRGDNAIQHAVHDRFAPLVERLRVAQEHVNEARKVTDHALAHTEKVLGARRQSGWDNAAVRDAVEMLAAGCEATVEAIRKCLYLFAQATWLQSRFLPPSSSPCPACALP